MIDMLVFNEFYNFMSSQLLKGKSKNVAKRRGAAS